jgi:hypothetical protein
MKDDYKYKSDKDIWREATNPEKILVVCVITGAIMLGLYFLISTVILIVHAETTTMSLKVLENPCNTAMAHAREVCQEYK